MRYVRTAKGVCAAGIHCYGANTRRSPAKPLRCDIDFLVFYILPCLGASLQNGDAENRVAPQVFAVVHQAAQTPFASRTPLGWGFSHYAQSQTTRSRWKMIGRRIVARQICRGLDVVAEVGEGKSAEDGAGKLKLVGNLRRIFTVVTWQLSNECVIILPLMSAYNTLYEEAAENYGLITTEMAERNGVSGMSLVMLERRGRLQRVGRGVYRLGFPGDRPQKKHVFVGNF